MAKRKKLIAKTKLVNGARVNISDGSLASPSTISQQNAAKTYTKPNGLPDPDTSLSFDIAQETTPAGLPDLSSLGISASAPAIDRKDVERQVKRETASARSALQGRFDDRIGDVKKEQGDQMSALQGQLGTRRRFSTSAQAFIGHIDEQYKQQVGDLEAQRDEALASFDMEMYSLIDKRIKDAREEWRGQVDDAMKMYELASKAGPGGGGEAPIVGLVAQGITDPTQLFQKLGGAYTTKEISDVLANLKPEYSPSGSFKFDTKSVSTLLGSDFTMSDIQTIQDDLNSGASISEILEGVPPEQQSIVKEALGVKASVNADQYAPGIGAKDGIDEYAIRTRLFPKVAAVLNKGTLSDTDRAVIDERISFFRENGYTEQQILDTVWGWSTQSPYNSRLQDVILANAKDGEDVSFTVSRIGSLINNGAYVQAVDAVENFALEKSKEVDPDGYFGKTTASTLTKKIDRIKQLLAKGGVVGFVEGNFQKLLGQIKGPDATRIRAELTDLYSEFRKQNAGVNVTEAETKYLTPLLADIGDPRANFMTKLDTFQTGILDRYNSTRRTASLPAIRVLELLDDNERARLYIGTATFNGNSAPEL